MTKPGVAIVIDSLGMGGAERSLIAIASLFRRYRPTLVTLYGDMTLSALVSASGLPHVSLGLAARDNALRAVPLLRGVLNALRPTVVHATLFRSEVAARFAAAGRWPLIGSYVNDSYSPTRFAALRPAGRLRLRLVQAIDAATATVPVSYLSNSRVIAESNAAALNVSTKVIEVIPRGRDSTEYAPVDVAQRGELRARFGWRHGDLIVLTVGRLLARKGHEELVDGTALLRLRRPNVRLAVAGEGPEHGPLLRRIDERGLAGAVELLGTRHDVADLMRACDLFVFPSHFEGLPGALIEAMLTDCKIVASDTPVHRETLGDAAAEYAAVGDAQSLAQAMERRLSMDERAPSPSPRACALRRYDLGRVAEAYEESYDRAIAAHLSGRKYLAKNVV